MIRPYAQIHWPDVKNVFLENVPEFFAPEELEDLSSYLSLHYRTYFVVVKNNGIVGAGGYHFQTTKNARLSWDFISPAHKGQGLGKLLIEHCIAEIKKKHASEIEVWTSQLAFRFYQAFGFNVIETRNDFWAKDLHLIKMKLAIKNGSLG